MFKKSSEGVEGMNTNATEDLTGYIALNETMADKGDLNT